MFFQDKSFRVMEAGMNAAWLQQQVHTHNISNYDTPTYKAKSLVFSEVITQSRTRGAEGKRLTSSALKVTLVEDDTTTIRPDGNNVDMDIESLSLYKSYVHYSMLLDKLKSEINNHNYVINNGPR